MTIALNFDGIDDFIKSYGSIAATIEECKKAKTIIAGPQSTEAPQPAKTAPKAEKPADIGKPIYCYSTSFGIQNGTSYATRPT